MWHGACRAALHQAILAANVGDTLDVFPGTYTQISVQKGIVILCRPGVVITSTAGPPVTVSGLPAGQTFLLCGGMHDATQTWPPATAVEVSSCAGTVILDAILPVVRGFPLIALLCSQCTGPVLVRHVDIGIDPNDSGIVAVDHCSNVSFTDCANLPPVRTDASNVSLANCTVIGRHPSSALTLGTGTVSVTGGLLQGGESWGPLWSHSGVYFLRASHLTLAGAVVVTGRYGTEPALDRTAGVIRIGPNVVIRSTHPTPIQGSAEVRYEPIPSLAASGVAAGNTFQLRVDGQPGILVATLVSWPVPPIHSSLGQLWVAAGSPVLDLGVVPASGARQVSMTVPPIPLRTCLALQPLAFVAGRIVLGTPTRVVMD